MTQVLRHAEEAEPADEPVEADGDGACAQFRCSEEREEGRVLVLFTAHFHRHLLCRWRYCLCWSAVSEIEEVGFIHIFGYFHLTFCCYHVLVRYFKKIVPIIALISAKYIVE